MKTRLLIFLAGLAVAGTSEAGPVGFLTQKQRDWAFIQSVGGMQVSLAKKQLLVACDVSGTKTITTKPTRVNSGIGVRRLKYSRVGSVIHLSVVTSVFKKG